MAAYQPPTPEEIRDIAAAYYQQRASKAVPVEHPTLVFVGGQIGAGKTAAATLVRGELRHQGGFIHLDADRMRERIDLRGAKPTSEQTQVAAGALIGSLRALSLEGRRNLVEEGTFRNADALLPLVQRIQSKGYRVELVAVATPLEESRLGIYQRFEAQHAQGVANPRFVTQQYHDETVAGFTNTVAKLEPAFDRVRVISRAGEIYYDNQLPTREGTAVDALTRGQTINDERLSGVIESWSIVRALAERRGADVEYLAAVDRQREAAVQYQVGRREFERAMASNRVPAASVEALRAAFEVEARKRFGAAPTHETSREVASVDATTSQRNRDKDHRGPER